MRTVPGLSHSCTWSLSKRISTAAFFIQTLQCIFLLGVWGNGVSLKKKDFEKKGLLAGLSLGDGGLLDRPPGRSRSIGGASDARVSKKTGFQASLKPVFLDTLPPSGRVFV